MKGKADLKRKMQMHTFIYLFNFQVFKKKRKEKGI